MVVAVVVVVVVVVVGGASAWKIESGNVGLLCLCDSSLDTESHPPMLLSVGVCGIWSDIKIPYRHSNDSKLLLLIICSIDQQQ